MNLRGDLPGGRRELRIQVGSFDVAVIEIPGRSLTDCEWREIRLARASFPAMWGASRADLFLDDPMDGRDSRIYDARHYIATVRDGESGPCKLVTMRKVSLVPSELTDRQRSEPFELLPTEFQFWQAQRGDGRRMPLWNVLAERARALAPKDEFAEFRVSAIGRTGTYPFNDRQRTARERERTGIAFAAIQLLATNGDPSLYYAASLCPEFQDRVLGVVDVDGVYVPPEFTRSEEILGLRPGSVTLDNRLQVVREHKAAFPGYFIDNEDAGRRLAALLDEGRVTLGDLRGAIDNLLCQEPARSPRSTHLHELKALAAGREHRRLAELLTRPRLFKYLSPLLTPGGPLSRLLREAGDGPFSSTLLPWRWAMSAWTTITAAEEKYGAVEPETARPAVLTLEPAWRDDRRRGRDRAPAKSMLPIAGA